MKQGKELAQILNNLDNLVTLAANDKLNIQQKNQVSCPCIHGGGLALLTLQQLRQIIASNVNDIVVRALGQNKPNPLRKGFLNSVVDPSRAWEHGDAIITPAEFERRVQNAEAEARVKIKDLKEKQQQKGNPQAGRPAAAGSSPQTAGAVSSPAGGPSQLQKQQGSSRPSSPAPRPGGTASPAPQAAQPARPPPPQTNPTAGPSSVKTASNPPSGAPSPAPGPSASGSAAATPPSQPAQSQPAAPGTAPTMPGPSAAVPPNIRPPPARPPSHLPMPPQQHFGPPGQAIQLQQPDRGDPPPGLFTNEEMKHVASSMTKAAREARMQAVSQAGAGDTPRRVHALIRPGPRFQSQVPRFGGVLQRPQPASSRAQRRRPNRPRSASSAGTAARDAALRTSHATASPAFCWSTAATGRSNKRPFSRAPLRTARSRPANYRFPLFPPGQPIHPGPSIATTANDPPAAACAGRDASSSQKTETQGVCRRPGARTRDRRGHRRGKTPALTREGWVGLTQWQIVNDTLDMFVDEVSRGAASLAKHRRSDIVEPKDMALYLGTSHPQDHRKS